MWRLFLGNILRIDDGDFCKALKVATVEGEKMCNTMHKHRRNEPRVVSLLTNDVVFDDKFFPSRKDICGIRQNGKGGFQFC